MVFGFFARSKDAPETPEQTQLRTPSPSESLSAVTLPPQSPELPAMDGKRGVKRSRSLSPNQGYGDEIGLPPSDPSELLALIKNVPAKTLHSYVLGHLIGALPQEIHALTEFFSRLVPPPKLHCVRCHKDFVDVENSDRSCLVPHDDESAEVEYVGASKSKVSGIVGTTYETLWGCCNKVVEGDGDQGPPDGWCYEGFHTTDVKRARFRADSTVHDDKLASCAKRRCFNKGEGSEGRGRSQRATARKSLKEESDEEEDYSMKELEREADALENDSESSTRMRKKKHAAQKRTIDAMEIEKVEIRNVAGSSHSKSNAGDEKAAGPSTAKVKTKAASMKPKPVTKSKAVTTPASCIVPHALPEDAVNSRSPPLDDESVTANKQKPKNPRKPRRSKGGDAAKYIPPKDEQEESTDFDEEAAERPKRKKRKSA